jgi:hypothetical protein
MEYQVGSHQKNALCLNSARVSDVIGLCGRRSRALIFDCFPFHFITTSYLFINFDRWHRFKFVSARSKGVLWTNPLLKACLHSRESAIKLLISLPLI